MTTDNPTRALLVQYLRDRPGEMITAYTIAKKNGLALASTRQTLNDMVEQGAIRRSGSRSSVTFYVPTEAMLAAEAKVQECNFRPLKPRPAMAERIAEIRAARAAIPSIY